MKKKLIAVVVGVTLFAGGIVTGATSDFIQSETDRVSLNLQRDMERYVDSVVSEEELQTEIEDLYDQITYELENHAHGEATIIKNEIDKHYSEKVDGMLSEEELEQAKEQITNKANDILQDEKQRVDEIINNILNGENEDGSKG